MRFIKAVSNIRSVVILIVIFIGIGIRIRIGIGILGRRRIGEKTSFVVGGVTSTVIADRSRHSIFNSIRFNLIQFNSIQFDTQFDRCKEIPTTSIIFITALEDES